MRANELNLMPQGHNFNLSPIPARAHYLTRLVLGRFFPTTKAQACRFLSAGCRLDVLNYEDVQTVEAILARHGYTGNYKYTRSGEWVQFQNTADLRAAIKKEFAL